MSKLKKIHKAVRTATCLYPILIHIVVMLNFMSYFFGINFTNVAYPLFGHSVLFDILMLMLSRLFRYCLWHRLLIYSLMVNIAVEFILINFDVETYLHDFMVVSAAMTTAFVLGSIISAFTHNLKKNK